ncbi:hypothetical protein CYMTET_51509, partial [Cymbomonas tetramitiformis]
GAFVKGGDGLITKEEEEGTKKREAEEKERAKKKDTSRPDLGDAPGVARDSGFALSDKDVIKRCSNANCLAREREGKKFLRCGRCKMEFYCSTHCQKTHWRDEHKAKCTPPAA